jgi:hypothetical protein
MDWRDQDDDPTNPAYWEPDLPAPEGPIPTDDTEF